MSDHSEAVPDDVLSDDADDQEWLTDAFADITAVDHERRHGDHDRDGYFAELAGSEKCLALGHVTPEIAWDDDFDKVEADHPEWAAKHPWSWDGERLCLDTRYGVACTACEGECDSITLPVVELWSLPGVRAA